MSGTVGTTPVCTIDANGLHIPTFATVLAWCQLQFQTIYGADIYLGNDCQDGQLCGVWAASINDMNSACAAVYAAFSPATAQGVGLSTQVAINGITRLVPGNSTVNLTIGGTVGTIITNGIASDGTYQWALPASVTIPSSGSIVVTGTCTTPGAIQAAPGTITEISTIQYGWQTVTNASAATAGAPVETDAALRLRQALSTAEEAVSPAATVAGDIAALSGVSFVGYDENTTSSTDANGVPAKSIAYVVAGGNVNAIANAIGANKTIGAGTYGSTSETYTDAYGNNLTIEFSRPTLVPITVSVTISVHNLTGYTSTIGTEIINAIVAYINSRPPAIQGDSMALRLTRLYVPAQLQGPYASPASPTDATTYELTSIQMCATGGSLAAADVALTFGQQPTCIASAVTLTVTT